jgi:hypothetical protein
LTHFQAIRIYPSALVARRRSFDPDPGTRPPHHYGIWNPWTLTFIGKREVDFWNLVKGEGTVRFAGFLSETEGPVYSGFRSLQQHIDFGARGGDAIAINEIFDVRAWNLDNQRWLIDYTSTLNTPLDSGILLAAYRYGGGIGFRATEEWNRDNSSVLTSENKDRKNADGSKPDGASSPANQEQLLEKAGFCS